MPKLPPALPSRGTRSSSNARVTLYETTPSTSRAAVPLPASDDRDTKPAKPKKITAPKATPYLAALLKPHPPPKRWEEAYELIRLQREGLVAAVDTMGCEQGGRDVGDAPTSDTDKRLSTLVSLMLSSQTKDPVTHQATQNLRLNLPGGLTVQSLLDATVEEIDASICKVGFHSTKAANLKKLAVRLRDLHNSDVPDDLPSLLAINGVGPKMSLLYLQSIGINTGIGVDVHVHRITNRLGWHKPPTATPEQTRVNLESWLPKHLHPKINLMLVGFGQTICKPVGPRCDLCEVAKVPRLCPSKRVVVVKREASSSPAKKGKRKFEGENGEDGDGRASKPKIEVEVEVEPVLGVNGGVKVEQEGVAVKVEQLAW